MNRFYAFIVTCAILSAAGCSEYDSSATSQVKRMTNGIPSGENSPAPDFKAKRMTNGVPLALDNELQNRKDGKWYWKGTTNLFTGIELNHHTNGVLKLRLPFTNGVPHGRRIMWHPNGQKEGEGDFENGARAGLWLSLIHI